VNILGLLVPWSSSSSEDGARSQDFLDRSEKEQENTWCKVHLEIEGCAFVSPAFTYTPVYSWDLMVGFRFVS
jgi:hypothetical protein